MQDREARQTLIFQAEMRGKGAWRNCTVHNISAYGLLVFAADPPRPGAYVEIRKASLVLIGRTVWVKGKAFGVRLIERLPFMAVMKAANESYAIAGSGATVRPWPPRHSASKTAIKWSAGLGLLMLVAACAGAQFLG